MILQKNLKAGTLLYALLMLGIFALLLQFYIQSQLAAGHAWQAKKLETQAYFMAQMTKEDYLEKASEVRSSKSDKQGPDKNDEKESSELSKEVTKEEQPSDVERKESQKVVSSDDKIVEKLIEVPTSGRIIFTAGQVIYETDGQFLKVQVQLNTGQTYNYKFPTPSNS